MQYRKNIHMDEWADFPSLFQPVSMTKLLYHFREEHIPFRNSYLRPKGTHTIATS